MYDNGLMHHYRQGFLQRTNKGIAKGGVLDLRKLPFRELGYSQRWGKGLEEYLEFLYTPQGRFYVKEDQKDGVDAEVLLSQIYKQAGLNTAIYTPAIDRKGKTVVLSNDIQTDTGIFAYDYLKMVRNRHKNIPTADGFPEKLSSSYVLGRYHTKEGARQYLKMNLFDVAGVNYDRHLSNYIYEVDRLGRVTDVSLYDFGESGHIYTSVRGQDPMYYEEDITYPNLFNDGSELTRQQMVDQFRNNEAVLSYITPSEMAESVGSINVTQTAKNIKAELGYKVSQSYTDYIASSFDRMAEDLVK